MAKKPKPRRANGAGSLVRRSTGGPWVARYFDGTGKRRERSTKTTSRSDAEKIMGEWVRRAALEREGLIEPADAGSNATYTEVLGAFIRSRAAAGRSSRYCDETHRDLELLGEALGWRTLGDLDADDLTEHAQRLTEQGRAGRTIAKLIGSAKTLSKWCVTTRRLRTDPLVSVERPSARARRERRALTRDEISELIAATEASGVRMGMAGPERALLYRVALQTALRAGEIRSLTRASLRLDNGTPHVFLSGASAKNGKAARQYVTTDLAEDLRARTVAMMPDA